MDLPSQCQAMGACKQAFIRFTAPRRNVFFALHQHCLPHRRHLSQLPALLAQGSEILPSLGQMDPFVGEAKSKPGQRRQHKQDGKTMENENLCIWYHLHQSVPPFFSCLLMFTTGQHWADFMSHTLMVCLCWHKPTLLEAQDCKVLQKWTDALTAFGCWRSSWLLDCAKSRSNTPTQSHWAKICQSRISSALSVPCRPLQLDTTGNFSDVTVSLSLAESKSQAESV